MKRQTNYYRSLLSFLIAFTVLLQALSIAYSLPTAQSAYQRLDFLTTLICTSNNENIAQTTTQHTNTQHNHCLQGCFLCAFCLTDHKNFGPITPQHINGHLIVWHFTTKTIIDVHTRANQPRAPPFSIKI